MKQTLTILATMLAFATAPAPGLAQTPPVGSAMTDAATAAAAFAPSRRIEGLWDEQVMQVDCHTRAPLHPIGRGTNLFTRDGALIATNNAPPTVMGITLGQWRYLGGRDRVFHVSMRLNLFQPPLETYIGYRDIQREITLSNHGDSLSGTVRAQDYFPEGVPSGSPVCATEIGTRIATP